MASAHIVTHFLLFSLGFAALSCAGRESEVACSIDECFRRLDPFNAGTGTRARAARLPLTTIHDILHSLAREAFVDHQGKDEGREKSCGRHNSRAVMNGSVVTWLGRPAHCGISSRMAVRESELGWRDPSSAVAVDHSEVVRPKLTLSLWLGNNGHQLGRARKRVGWRVIECAGAGKAGEDGELGLLSVDSFEPQPPTFDRPLSSTLGLLPVPLPPPPTYSPTDLLHSFTATDLARVIISCGGSSHDHHHRARLPSPLPLSSVSERPLHSRTDDNKVVRLIDRPST